LIKYNLELNYISEKKLAHAYFRRRIFLSLLAGKLKIFKQMLRRSDFLLKSWRMRIIGARIFSKVFGGKKKTDKG